MEAVNYYKMRDKEYGDESKWFRTDKGNTIDLMYFVLKVPLDDEESFKSELDKKIKYFYVTKTRKRDMWEKLTLDYARNTMGDTRGLGLFCLKKGGGDPEKGGESHGERD